jgi:hypothetical protein
VRRIVSGVSIAEREYYQLLLDLDELDLASGVTRGVSQLLLVTGASEAHVELRGPGTQDAIIRDRYTAPGLATRPPDLASPTQLEAMHETGTSRAHVRLERRGVQRPFTARHRRQLELFVRALVRLADRTIPLDLAGGLHAQRRLLDQRMVAAALAQTRGNVAEAARLLGVTRAFIYAQRARHDNVA